MPDIDGINPAGVAELEAILNVAVGKVARKKEDRMATGIVRAGRVATGAMLNNVTSFPDPTDPSVWWAGILRTGEGIEEMQERGTRERREDDEFPIAGPAVIKVTPGNRGVPPMHVVRDAAYTPEEV